MEREFSKRLLIFVCKPLLFRLAKCFAFIGKKYIFQPNNATWKNWVPPCFWTKDQTSQGNIPWLSEREKRDICKNYYCLISLSLWQWWQNCNIVTRVELLQNNAWYFSYQISKPLMSEFMTYSHEKQTKNFIELFFNLYTNNCKKKVFDSQLLSLFF